MLMCLKKKKKGKENDPQRLLPRTSPNPLIYVRTCHIACIEFEFITRIIL